jgi:hypothetical protein
VLSDFHGKDWYRDTMFVTDTPRTVESYTQLSTKAMFAYSVVGSTQGVSRLFTRTEKDGPWKPVPTDLPPNYNYYLSHNGSTLIATDYDNVDGAVWYSNDNGTTFKKFTGIPAAKTILYATYAPFDEVLMIGASDGLYRYNGSTFVRSSSGIENNTKVYGITAKSNLYKNDALKKVVYLATSTGIYASEDLGISWVKQKTGDYRVIY